MNDNRATAWPRRVARTLLPLGIRRRLVAASNTRPGLALRVLLATRHPTLTVAAVRSGATSHLNELARVGSVRGGVVAYGNVRVRLRPADVAASWHILHTAPLGWSVREELGAYLVRISPGNVAFTVPYGLLPDAMGALIERFLLEEYAQLDVVGAVVIDIGAYIGDSAIYMARRGAARVYSYEPFPQLASVARDNVARNGLTEVITVTAAGVGWPAGMRRASFRQSHSMMSSTVSAGGADRVTVESFGDVLDRAVSAHPGAPLVCKIDCEAAEREFFTPELLPDAFSAVVGLALEWHESDPGPVIDDLRRRDFAVVAAPTGGQPGAPTMIFARRKAAAAPALNRTESEPPAKV